MIKQEMFADECYKEAVRRERHNHRLQMHTIENMTPIMRLDRAHKFNLSWEIAEAARDAFYEGLAKTHNTDWTPFMRLLDVTVPPFEHTWIDMPMKWTSAEKHQVSDDGLIGFLLHRTPKSYVVDICVCAEADGFGDRAGSLPVAFLIAPNGHDLPFIDSGTWKEYVLFSPDRTKKAVVPRVWYRFRGAEKRDADVLDKFLNTFLSLLIGCLALINVAPTIKETYRPKGSSLVRGKIKPYFSKTKITLELPHKRVSSIMRGVATGRGSPRRHSVRGHFRHYVGESGELLRRTWIRDHHRGDGTIGWVRQDHEVVAKGHHVQINPLVFEEPREA
jgi:hypothetical protein